MKAEEEKAFQKIFFGSLYPSIFDKIYIILDNSIKECVSTLPFLPSTNTSSNINNDDEPRTSKEKLIHTLKNVYSSRLEYLELYSSRNIFTIGCKLTKEKRKKLIEMWGQYDNLARSSTATTEDEENDKKNNTFLKDIEENQKQNDIQNDSLTMDDDDKDRSSTSSISIDEEIKKLANRKSSLQHTNQVLLSRLESLSKVKSYQSQVSQVLLQNKNNNNNSEMILLQNMEDKVRNITQEKTKFDGLVIQSRDLLQNLNENVIPETNTRVGSDSGMTRDVCFNPNKMDIEEDYEYCLKEQREITSYSCMENVDDMLHLLQEGNK